MSILYLARFKQAQPAGFDGVFEWDFLNDCFPRNIKPMDFDGVVEINGNFIVFETKAEDVPVPQGQVRTFKALLRNPAWTIFLVNGKTADTISKVTIRHLTYCEVINPADERILKKRVCDWVNFAEGNPR